MKLHEAMEKMKKGDICCRKHGAFEVEITEDLYLNHTESDEPYDFDQAGILADDWEIIKPEEPKIYTSALEALGHFDSDSFRGKADGFCRGFNEGEQNVKRRQDAAQKSVDAYLDSTEDLTTYEYDVQTSPHKGFPLGQNFGGVSTLKEAMEDIKFQIFMAFPGAKVMDVKIKIKAKNA